MLRLQAVALVLASVASSHAGIGVRKVAPGFECPVWAGMPAGSSGKLWVMEQAGKVWIVDLANGARSEQPFLDIGRDVTRKGNEQGLLGLAFAPDFLKTGRYYVDFTDQHSHTRIVRFTSKDHQTTDPATAGVMPQSEQPFQNHNGGWIGFGPDGMLYIGDGGSGNDPKGNGQSLETLLGKILRIDVSADSGYRVPPDNPFVGRKNAKPEIRAYGVRNPWRCSFDRKTGDFWIGDVGQNRWEEVDFMPRGKGPGGNAPPDAVESVDVYKHGGGSKEGMSVTGGYVYRGSICELQGRYIFADYQNPRIWSFVLKNGRADDFKDHTAALQPEGGRITLIPSFAGDNDGELFIVDLTGTIHQIVGG